MLFLAAAAIALTSTLHAQSVASTWQATLPPSEFGRVVIKIAASTSGPLSGTLTFIDHGSAGSPLLSLSFTPPDLNFAISSISYRGKLAPDGKSLTGTWTRDNLSHPLTFALATPDTLWAYAGPALPPMAATADPSFEVATIKPSRPDARYGGLVTRTRQFQARANTVSDLLCFAYHVRDRQIQGAPAWANDLRFDIVAEPDAPGQPSFDQFRLMVKKLLADRFGLSLHTVQIDFPVYALTIVKAPPKLTRSDSSAEGHGSIQPRDGADGDTTLQFVYETIPEFLETLMGFIPDRQIVDETGLAGQFDFKVLMPTAVLHGSDDGEKANALMSGVQPLGFKLIPKKAPIQVLVIDHLDKPTPN